MLLRIKFALFRFLRQVSRLVSCRSESAASTEVRLVQVHLRQFLTK